MPGTVTDLRLEFFRYIFGGTVGYVCIATGDAANPRKTFRQKFFHWPTQAEQMEEFIDLAASGKNIWFGVNLLSKPERLKEFAIPHNLVWSDLDACKPDEVSPPPSVVIASSRDRYQAIWKLDQTVPPEVAEDYAKRIAYSYNQSGADPSGWDLTQLLRVPFTKNYKYPERPNIIVLPDVATEPVSVMEFEQIELAPASLPTEEGPETPEIEELPEPEKVIYKYQAYLDKSFHELYTISPELDEDWSARMWKLINLCFEAGMESDEVFAVALSAKCNKYVRDRRPLRYLWREVQKAYGVQKRITAIAGTWEPLIMPSLVTHEECTNDTFIDKYRQWAAAATDAVPTYHDLCGAIILSAVLAGLVRVEVQYGTLIPNLWGLVLGESTLTRKTTAMAMAVSLLREVDQDAILATDGSPEGILTALSTRPGRASLFYKDEVTGLFDAINRKDYLAGMPETLTQLYDGESYKRVLRREEITITRPVFIFFGGGIRDKTYSLLNDNYILSGFLPRFLVINGTTDLTRLRRTGPRTGENYRERQTLINHLADLREAYTPQGTMKVGSAVIQLADVQENRVQAQLTQEAWNRYGDFEEKLVQAAYDNFYSTLALPTFERLSRSLLKLAVLLAADRQTPTNAEIKVELRDVNNAARFIQDWGRHSVEMILNVGKSSALRLMEKVRQQIEERPGVQKSEIMRRFHVSSRELNEIVINLVDRGEITTKRKGRAERFWIT